MKNWNAAQFFIFFKQKMQRLFRSAVQECNARCLKNSSKFLNEQLLGMIEDEDNDEVQFDRSDCFASICSNREYDTIQFVLSILDNGEYQRSAQYMLNFIKSHRHSAKKDKSISKISHFLYLYSLYMAGEMIKEQEEEQYKARGNKNPNSVPNSKSASTTPNKNMTNTFKNPCLIEIYNDLHPKYIYTMKIHREKGVTNDSNVIDNELILDSYLLYLYGVVLYAIKKRGGGAIIYGNKDGNRSHNAGSNLNPRSKTSPSNSMINNEADDVIINQYADEFIQLDQIHANDQPSPLGHHTDNMNLIPKSSSYYVLFHALCMNPLNWSCWIEFSQICINEKYPIPFTYTNLNVCLNQLLSNCNSNYMDVNADGEELMDSPSNGISPEIYDILVSYLAKNPMQIELFRVLSMCFLVHIYLEQHNGEEALKICEQYLIKVFPNSIIVQSNIALCYYTLRDYDVAHQCFAIVREKDPSRMEEIDTYSNILYVKECRSALSHLAHSVMKINKYNTQTCCIVGNYYSLKGKHEKAILYFRRAIKINPNYLSAWTLMGHELVELRNTSAAVYCYRRAIEISNGNDYRAWYSLGQTYEMLHLHQYAYYYYKKAVILRPNDSRMWCAVGSCLYHMACNMDHMGASTTSMNTSNIYKQEVINVYKHALQCGDNEGIAMKQLPKLYKEIGCYDKAVELYETYYLQDIISNATNANNMANANSSTMSTDAYRNNISSSSYSASKFHASRNLSPRSTPTGQYPVLDISNDISTNSSFTPNPKRLNKTPNSKNSELDHNVSTVSYLSNMDMSLCLHPSKAILNNILSCKEKIDSILFVASYYKSIHKYKRAEMYCMYLLDLQSNQGNEARSMLRELRNLTN